MASLLSGLHPKGAAAAAGRRASARAFADFASNDRDPARPLVILHAPSVGEALMAQAIIEKMRAATPDVQVAFTFFSPSAERIASRIGADIAGYLPLDSQPTMRAFVQALKPSVVAFVRTEIWPMLGLEAMHAGARTALVNAVLSEGSSRLSGPARYLLGPAYGRLDVIGAVARTDADRFALLGVSPQRVFVTGDARFDQVRTRISSIDRSASHLSAVQGARPIVVAGSTWREDEDLIIGAVTAMDAGVRPRLVIAPHEPTAVHVESLAGRLDAATLSHTTLSNAEADGAGDASVIIVDRVGVLADMYAIADIAYMGGGFGTNGLHSVIEPAALGVPVLYGPAHGNAREAADLAGAGGGFVVHDRDGLAKRLVILLNDATAHDLAGTAAMEFVQSRLGGAEANGLLLSGLIKR